MNTYKFTDNVIARIAQIVQEGMLTGTDVVDTMRQIVVKTTEEGSVDLTDEYMASVRQHHEDMVKQAKELQRKSSSKKTHEA
jgi:hypothetical protein